jgi:hypothetical protein
MESIGPLMATLLQDTAYKCAAALGSANTSGRFVSFDEIIGGHFPK